MASTTILEKSITRYYFDNSATTRMSDTVLKEMLPYFQTYYGNASSIYTLGRDSREAYISASNRAAKAIGAESSEIYFTSGGSESDNWALKSVAALKIREGKTHFISTKMEHPAILKTLERLKEYGITISFLPVYEDGRVHPEDLKNFISDKTGLVSIMSVNNETGMIQPIKEIGKICRERDILFHTDAVQAMGNIPINVNEMNIDLLSLSGHKIHGPKGIGLLYMRKGLWLDPLIDGGGQEKGRRAGTENIPAIVGFGKALEEAANMQLYKKEKLKDYQEQLFKKLLLIPGVTMNGSIENRVASNVNVSFPGIEAKKLVYSLDNMFGIAVSSVSACGCKESRPSHVLLAMGKNKEEASSSIRITMSVETTEEEVKYFLSHIEEAYEEALRSNNSEN